ncbi:hypothetical protein Tdes44962_MAKER08112 [Teratosphaeria destructans]|uniref:Uncharacterized protein n=1 Tax=Teratosphaeria destructans TaxID=418781 RepID=A0A9W7W4X5_9PEZI|nr:hypothetical protein Tdes44962_MAKER08112 [Teratosphaeria destructans]
MSSFLGTAVKWIGGQALGARDEEARDKRRLREFQQEIKEVEERQRQKSLERDLLQKMRPGRLVRDPEWERVTPLTAHGLQDNQDPQPKTSQPRPSRKVPTEEEAAATPKEFRRWSSESLVSYMSDFVVLDASDGGSPASPKSGSPASLAQAPSEPRFSLTGFSDSAHYTPDRARLRRQYFTLPPLPKTTDWGYIEPPEELPILQHDTLWHTNRPSNTLGPDSKYMRGIGRFKLWDKIDLEEVRKRLLEDIKGPNALMIFGPGNMGGPHHPLETTFYLRCSEMVEEKIQSGEMSPDEKGPLLFQLWRQLQIDLLPSLESARYKLGVGRYSSTVTNDGCVVTTGFGPAFGVEKLSSKELRALALQRANDSLAQEDLIDRPVSPSKRPGRRVTFDTDLLDPPEKRKLVAERELRRSLSDLTHIEKEAIAAKYAAQDAEDAVDSDDDCVSEASSEMSYDTESDCSGYGASPLTRAPSKELSQPAKGILKVGSRPVSPASSSEGEYDIYQPVLTASGLVVKKPTLAMSKSLSAHMEAEHRFAQLEKAGVLKSVNSNDYSISENESSSPSSPYAAGAIGDVNITAATGDANNHNDGLEFSIAAASLNSRRNSSDSAVAMASNNKSLPSISLLRPALKQILPAQVMQQMSDEASVSPKTIKPKPKSKGARVSFSSQTSVRRFTDDELVSSLKRHI